MTHDARIKCPPADPTLHMSLTFDPPPSPPPPQSGRPSTIFLTRSCLPLALWAGDLSPQHYANHSLDPGDHCLTGLADDVGESGHTPDTFSLEVIWSATVQVRRTANTVSVGPMCGLHN